MGMGGIAGWGCGVYGAGAAGILMNCAGAGCCPARMVARSYGAFGCFGVAKLPVLWSARRALTVFSRFGIAFDSWQYRAQASARSEFASTSCLSAVMSALLNCRQAALLLLAARRFLVFFMGFDTFPRALEAGVLVLATVVFFPQRLFAASRAISARRSLESLALRACPPNDCAESVVDAGSVMRAILCQQA